MTVSWASLALAASLSGAPIAGVSATHAPQPGDPSDRRPGAWIAAVRAHEPGQTDRALLTVAAWTQRDIERILPSVAAEPDAARVLAQGLVLHADIGVAEEAGGVAGGVRVMTLIDGRASGNRRVSLQWGIGRLIAGTLVALPIKAPPGYEAPDAAVVERARRERLGVARAWYRATATVLQEAGHLGFLHTHVNAGLSLLGDDAVLLMYRATIRQGLADPRLQMFARPGSGVGSGPVERASHLASGPVGVVTRPQHPSFELGQAGRDLRRALELDPQLVEARIRLAHVLADQGRHDEAATLLRPVMSAALPPFLEYYGALLLGRAEERLGRLPEARAAYERAGRQFPQAQVPRVALSRLALLDGRAGDGLDLLLQAPRAADTDAAEDPWWWYFRSHDPNAGALIAELRRAAP